MLFFLALSALAAATFGSVMLYQRGEERRRLDGGGPADPRLLLPERKPKEPPARRSDVPTRSGEPTLETLQRGDIVVDGDEDWLISGTLHYREEQDTWTLHALEGGARHRFLEVRRRHGALEAAIVDVVDDLPRGQLLQGLTYAGQGFSLEARGDARVLVDGDVFGLSSGGRLAWSRYSGTGGALLLVEDHGAGRRGLLGSRVPMGSLSFMSGELNRDEH